MARVILTPLILLLGLLGTVAPNAFGNDAVLVAFVSQSCAPCQAMRPVIGQLTSMGAAVRQVEVSREPELVKRYGVRETPTYVVISGGKEQARLVGVQPLPQLVQALSITPPSDFVNTSAAAIERPETRLAPLPTMPAARPAGAAADGAVSQASATQPAYDPMQVSGPESPQSDGIRRAQAATVRLRVFDGHGYGVGTGTVIDTHGDEALVLTCGHLFRDTQGQGKIEVDVFDNGSAKTIPGQLIDYDADERDVALVSIRPGFPIQPVPIIRAGKLPEVGSGVFSYGCDRGDNPSRRDTRVTGVNKYNQDKGASNIEISGAPIDGRSGGGLFDGDGCLIGVCNSADYKGDIGIYAGPGAVHWQLDRVQLSRLYHHDAAAQLAAAQIPQAQVPQAQGGDPSSLASLTNLIPASPAAQPAAAQLPQGFASVGAADHGVQASLNDLADDQEMIVIIRDRDNPQAGSRVMTLAQPSSELLRMVESQAYRR